MAREAALSVIMPLLVAVRHPAGLVLLAMSLIVALAVAFLPQLADWRPAARWLLLWGAVSYGVVVVVLHRSRPHWGAPELDALYTVRENIAARRRTAEREGRSADLLDILGETVSRLDDQLLPIMHQVVARAGSIKGDLDRYQRGDLPSPDPEVLNRLRRLHTRQTQILRDSLREAANADGALAALLQEGSDPAVAARLRSWSGELLSIYDNFRRLIDEAPGPDSEPEPESQTDPTAGSIAGSGPAPSVDLEFFRATEEAMRRINNPGALAYCGLIGRVSLSVDRALREEFGRTGVATSLQRASVLRLMLVAAVERLRPPSEEPGEARGAQYEIVKDEYLRELSNKQIMIRLSLSEATFHRRRRDGVMAIARDLRQREELLQAEAAPQGAAQSGG